MTKAEETKPKRAMSPERQVASIAAMIRKNKSAHDELTLRTKKRMDEIGAELVALEKSTAPDVWKLAVELAEKFGA